ncbi:MAG TPA: hypothetical protein PKH24_05300 [Sedimentisphaerales bacterium]|jgi:hypothetical protein|nr:hypothetical protein [Sedimentisphaerales bacterium]HNU29035.1 hypothetical protein [Sedimentisphaerales bacterium]
MRRHNLRIAERLTFLIFVCLAVSYPSHAALVIDQQSDAPNPVSVSNGPGVVLFQTFKPTASTLDLVRLTFCPGGGFPPAGYETSISIRSGDPDGPELGSASAMVEGSVGEAVDAYFWFPSLPLTPGATYFIE